MELTSRELLRRAVRRAVHQACWQRLEGDHEHIHASPAEGIAEARSSYADVSITDEEVKRWIVEDEAEFDRAVLISDLVARRVQRTAPPAPVPLPVPTPVVFPAGRAETTASAAASPEVVVRSAVRTAPSITALLDDMLAQRAATDVRKPSR